MERYLLFDSGCSKCTQLVHAIECEVDGPFTIRSLRDPAVQELLDKADPDWRWEPTWLEVKGETVRVYTGLAMGLRLVQTLGPRRALRLIKLVNRYSVSFREPIDPNRRYVLKQSISAFVTLVLLLGWPKSLLFRERKGQTPSQQVASNRMVQEPNEGEIWEGFLLLPEGASVPKFVIYPELGIPIVCGVGVAQGGAIPTAVSEIFNSVEALAQVVNFPVYTLDHLPEGLRVGNVHLIKHRTGEIFAAFVAFHSYNKTTNNWETIVSIWAHPEFPRPFPLWSSNPVEPDGPAVRPMKVDFLPSPGVEVTTQAGYVYHWIRQEVLYTLTVEPSPNEKWARNIASALVPLT